MGVRPGVPEGGVPWGSSLVAEISSYASPWRSENIICLVVMAREQVIAIGGVNKEFDIFNVGQQICTRTF